MAISFKRYVDITSGIGAGVRVPGRELIGRIFTPNPLAPTNTIMDFEAAEEVASFFGSDSEEYKRAAFYFGFISKTQVRPRKLSFVRMIDRPVAASLRGVYECGSLQDFQAVTDGSFALVLDDQLHPVTGRDFSAATSYADVASIIQDGIRGIDSTGMFVDATVTFDPINRAFTFTAGETKSCRIAPAVKTDGGTPIGTLLRWEEAQGALASDGMDLTSVTDQLNSSTDQSNNYGSFLFMRDLALEQMEEAANFAHLSNIQFKYCQRVTVENASAVAEALKNYSGVALTEAMPGSVSEFPEMAPMVLLAATDYTRLNGTQNYMFQQFNLTPSVTDNKKANQLDELRVNYYGRTQQAGQLIDFYQRGVLQGSVQDMNIYANEMWLKDQAGAQIMTLKLALPEIAANDSGRALIAGCLQNVIEMALRNGVISVNKELNFTQKAFITQVTGDDNAWVQVQSQGYWLNVEIQEYTAGNRVEYKAVYLLIYSKKDVIRKTEGTHSLI